MRNSLTRRVAIVFTTAVWPRWQGSGRSQDQPRWRGCSSRTGRSCRRCHWPAGRPSRWTGPAPHTNRPAVGGCEICAPPCWAIAEDCTRQEATDVRTGPPATVWWKAGLMIPDGGGSADTETDGATHGGTAPPSPRRRIRAEEGPSASSRADVWLNGHHVTSRKNTDGAYVTNDIDVTPSCTRALTPSRSLSPDQLEPGFHPRLGRWEPDSPTTTWASGW